MRVRYLGLLPFLAACVTASSEAPVGAPPPTHGQMMYVDADGCSWWVIGNATDLSWARQTDGAGQPVCRTGDPDAPVPFVSPTSLKPAAAATSTAGGSVVQVATFAKADNAARAAARLTALGQPVRGSSTSPGPDGFYRLVLGPFAATADAQAALAAAKAEGFADAFVTRR